jgi:hypothetical protein
MKKTVLVLILLREREREQHHNHTIVITVFCYTCSVLLLVADLLLCLIYKLNPIIGMHG